MCQEDENEKRLEIPILFDFQTVLSLLQCNSAGQGVCECICVCMHWHCTNSISQNYSQTYFSHSLQLSNWNAFNFLILRIRWFWLYIHSYMLIAHCCSRSHTLIHSQLRYTEIFRNRRIWLSPHWFESSFHLDMRFGDTPAHTRSHMPSTLMWNKYQKKVVYTVKWSEANGYNDGYGGGIMVCNFGWYAEQKSEPNVPIPIQSTYLHTSTAIILYRNVRNLFKILANIHHSHTRAIRMYKLVVIRYGFHS